MARTVPLRHLLVLLTALGLLPLALLGAWSVHATREYREREQERTMLDLARALSSAVDAELDGTVATLGSMARTPAIESGDIARFYELARAQAEAQPDWLGVVLTDADGQSLFRTTAAYGTAPRPVTDPASLQQVLALRHPVVGQVSRGKGGRVAFPVRIPITSRDGRLYTLTAIVQPNRVLRVVQQQRIPRDAVIAVLDASRRVVARSRDHERVVTGPPSPTLLRMIAAHGPENVGLTTTMEGTEAMTAYTTLSRYGWTVAIGTPVAALHAAFLQELAVYGAGILLSLAVFIGLGYWLAGRIVRNIASLQASASALGAGRQVKVKPSRIDEIQAMGAALATAAEQRDVREQERSLLLASLERALAQAREAGLAKDEFLAVLGHELRNPLSPIVSSLDLMDLRDEPDSRRERGIMRRQVSHLKRLVDDLLDVSRITSGKLQIEPHGVNLAELVRHAVAALPGQPVRVDSPPAVWVRGDDSRLVQVLNNLLSNAARFGSTDTRVTLEAAEGQARLAVTDNGIGMEGDLAARVFEPFFQAPQPLARRTGGLGLGLAIVRRIVELHGGSVSARSEGPGLGSHFEVVLPLAEGPDAAPEPTPLVNPGARRVLLVDDNVDAAASTAALLRRIGHRVEIAHTAAGGLALARGSAFDAAILDIGLPDMDGYQLARAIRQLEGGAGLRLLALTGYGQRADVQRAMDAGFDQHLTKPASLEELERAIALTSAA